MLLYDGMLTLFFIKALDEFSKWGVSNNSLTEKINNMDF